MQVKLRHLAAWLAAWLTAWLTLSWTGGALVSQVDQGYSETAAARQARGETGRAVESAPASEADTFYSRYRSFGLPITVLQAPFQIRAVQLHVSTDGGTTWRIHSEEPATRQEFAFQTPQDGEYWFASKTVDTQNTVRPSGPTRAEQHVVVDTENPRLEARADATARGTVRIAWRIADRNIDPRSLSIEYQVPPREQWTPIELPPELLVADRGVMEGQFDWQPDVPSRVVHLSVRVKDLAGNVAAESSRVYLPRVAARPGAGQTPPGITGRDSTRRDSTRPDPQAAQTPAGVAPVPGANASGGPRHSSGAPGANPPGTGIGTNPRPLAGEAEKGWSASQRPRPTGEPPSDLAERTGESDEPPGERTAVDERGEEARAEARTGPGQLAATATQWPETTSALPGNVRPQVAEQVPSDPATSGGPVADEPSEPDSRHEEPLASDAAWPAIPPGESLRMTRARRFYLEYDIESAGPEGVAEVELWATQDGGQTWEKWGVDADKQSPLDVQVDDEGIYGFRIVVVGKNGLAAAAPRPGTPADLWVGVDQTPPAAEITAVAYGTGARSGELDIRWIAEDRRLSSRPISLSFGESRAGPWTTIATGLPNSRQYFWKLDASIPKRIYLRIECQDEAGNSSEFITAEPVNAEGLSPKGRIRGFRPAETEPSSGTSASRWWSWFR